MRVNLQSLPRWWPRQLAGSSGKRAPAHQQLMNQLSGDEAAAASHRHERHGSYGREKAAATKLCTHSKRREIQ